MLTIKIEEIPEEGLNLEWVEERDSISSYLKNFSNIDFDFETPLFSNVRVKKAGKSILIKGGVKTTLRLQCGRCLKEFLYPITTNFDLTFFSIKDFNFPEEVELSEEDMEMNFYEGSEIHLSEIAFEQVFLEIPYQPLCDKDCKGLCTFCGQDLNVSPCNCINEEVSNSFSILRKLIKS